jgi:uncharacterized protein (TIGR03067 family)
MSKRKERRILLLTILLVGAPFMAADTEPEPSANNAAPPKATGPLSPQEDTFQGDWKAYSLEKNRLEYAMTFEGRDFHARARPDDKDRDERYEGYIVIRTDVEPAQIDFVVLKESGEPGRISKGIFYFDGETVIIKAPESGLPRPQDFESSAGPIALLRLSRDG